MVDDPIGDALAIALEAIEEHGKDPRYMQHTDALAVLREAMEAMQLLLQQVN